ncbi:MAG: hypothetical protein CVU77_00390 [Elusimicrobia bacterium HGW-Elusimicrobia-1]|jgi:hypothetical protein|nr:MAG: hypothetical protein CVU77_00390 [Elusimicrobia bacterium HGW-Elusimicrobia-1]
MAKIAGSMSLRKIRPAQATAHGLPASYGDTKIVALPRDPLWIYVYWEINQNKISALTKKLPPKPKSRAVWALRVYDITGVKFNGRNALAAFDIFVAPESGSWHINCGRVNRVWCVEIGVIGADGVFTAAARSNPVASPRFGISDKTDEKWGITEKDFEKIIELSGGLEAGAGSVSMARLMTERWKELMSMPSSGVLSGRSKSNTSKK